jgi:DNA polymerase-3 subunit delta'
MQFSEIIGQSTLKTELTELMQENRLAHALLFLGKEGSGALPLAIAFAQYIVCEATVAKAIGASENALFGASLFGEESVLQPEKKLPNEVCGVCPACQKMKQLIHPDVHFSYPVVPKKSGSPPISTDYISEWREFIKSYPYGNAYDWLQFINAENKQGNITAHECNDIIRKLNLKSFEGGYKILIMWLPEYLGAEGNKLLKLIEEPPEKTVFILVAENDALILPTILSRCQIIKVPVLNDEEIREALIERNHTDAVSASRIAAVSQGNYREALQMAQHADEDWQTLLRDWLNAIMRGGPMAQAKWVEEIARLGREKQKQFLKYFNHLLRLAVRTNIIPDEGKQYSETDRDFAVRLNKVTGMEQQQAIAEELDKAAYYIERNANAKMLFMALTIKIYHIIQNKIVFLNE